MNRVFVDMDGVLVDFDAHCKALGLPGSEVKGLPGAYLAMSPIPGALAAVRDVIAMGFEVWIATKPPTGVPGAYADKVSWVLLHLPELAHRIIITHDKGLLGDESDFLCDDRPHKANCERFAGTLLRFADEFHWPEALDVLRTAAHKDAHRLRLRTAAENARQRLVPGDRIRVTRCPGTKRWVTFAGWDGEWIVSKSGISDIAAVNVDRLNGDPVDFCNPT